MRIPGYALLVAALILGAGLSGCGEEDEGEAGVTAGITASAQTPGIGSFTFVMGTDLYEIPDTPMPAKGQTFSDPLFNAPITRITDRGADGYTDAGISNEYARSDPENSDGTLAVLRGNDGDWYIYEAATLEMKQRLSGEVNAENAPELEPRWDAADPNILYFLSDAALKRYDVATGSVGTVHDFGEDYGGASSITTGSEGDASLDRGNWCFMLADSDGDIFGVIDYDMRDDEIRGSLPEAGGEIDYVSSDMSGGHCIIGWDERPMEVFSSDFSSSVDLPEGVTGHSDFAITADGKDVLVYQNTATDWIAMADLDSGQETNLLEIPFSVNTDIGLHMSGNSSRTPGWVLVSTYGSRNPPPDESHSWMDTQLFMVELEAEPRVWRLAHTQSYTSIDYEGEKNYFAEAFAAINTSGTRVYWGSNWGRMDTDYTEAYKLDLPQGWPALLPP